jgi:hypothetical protein
MTIPIVSPQATNDSDSPIRLPAGGVMALNYHPLPGRVGNLTAVQLHTLDKLKEQLKDQGQFVKERMDDAMLLRWPPYVSIFHCYFCCLIWSRVTFFYASDSCAHANSIS